MNPLDIQMNHYNTHIEAVRVNSVRLEKGQNKRLFLRDSSLVNRTLNNISYISELENMVNELRWREDHKNPKASGLPLIPKYSANNRFDILLKVIKNQEKRIKKLEQIIDNK